MTARRASAEQNSAYGSTTPTHPPRRDPAPAAAAYGCPEMPEEPAESRERPYPETWERVAELRVFRTTVERWQRLISWRADMQRRGWRLLRVDSKDNELHAVFGRTREALLGREERSS